MDSEDRLAADAQQLEHALLACMAKAWESQRAGKRPTNANLVFVPTPIGNMADMSLRALQVLMLADVVCCEDTRHSRPLLNFFGIRGQKLLSLHSHNEQSRVEEVLERVEEGAYVAVISDAGTPMISDPGYRLLAEALRKNIAVEVLPGACALIPALAASGLASDQFVFMGFLPQKSGRRARLVGEALERERTTVFYESPYRLMKTLKVIAELAGERQICVARELSKRHEEFLRGTASEVMECFGEARVRGEIVLMVSGVG